MREWIWYFTMCQLFKDELKNGTNSDLYTNMYNEILSFPSLTGEIEKDILILEGVYKNHFIETKSPTRNGLMIYHIRFRDEKSLL